MILHEATFLLLIMLFIYLQIGFGSGANVSDNELLFFDQSGNNKKMVR